MKTFILLVLSCLIFLISCGVSTNLTLSGAGEYKPLDDNQNIFVSLIEDSLDNFTEIGVVEIYKDNPFAVWPSLNELVDIVKGIARTNGANCVILINDLLRPGKYQRVLTNYWFRIGYKKYN